MVKERQVRKYIIGGALMIVVTLLVFWSLAGRPRSGNDAPHSITANKVYVRRDCRPNPVEPFPRKAPRQRAGKQRFRFAASPLGEDPDGPKGVVYPAFKTGGTIGGRLTVRNQSGKLIYRGTEELPVFSIEISPNEELIWVEAGDGNSYILNLNGEKIVDLPQFPPGKYMLGLGAWVWLDNNRLLGESGVQNFDDNGKPIDCCQGHNISESHFYVYDLQTNKMEEMQLPEDLRGKVVTIGKVLKTGEFQLGNDGDGFDWYQVADLGGKER